MDIQDIIKDLIDTIAKVHPFLQDGSVAADEATLSLANLLAKLHAEDPEAVTNAHVDEALKALRGD